MRLLVATVVGAGALGLAAGAPLAPFSAEESTTEMYAFWCTGKRAVNSPICQHSALATELAMATDPADRRRIADSIHVLIASTRAASPGAADAQGKKSDGTLFAKEYSEMKMAFCTSPGPSAKTLCGGDAAAASQYRLSGAMATKSGSQGSTATTAFSEVMAWYCALPDRPTHGGTICKRSELLDQIRTLSPQTPEHKAVAHELKVETSPAFRSPPCFPTLLPLASLCFRTTCTWFMRPLDVTLSPALQEYPMPTYGVTEAIFADFCKVGKHAESHVACIRLKQTHAAITMQKWYCAQETSKDSKWCVTTSSPPCNQQMQLQCSLAPHLTTRCARLAVLDKLRKTPATDTEARLALQKEYAAFVKKPTDGSPNPSVQLEGEIARARAMYCSDLTNRMIDYCKTKALSMGTAGVEGVDPLSALAPSVDEPVGGGFGGYDAYGSTPLPGILTD